MILTKTTFFALKLLCRNLELFIIFFVFSFKEARLSGPARKSPFEGDITWCQTIITWCFTSGDNVKHTWCQTIITWTSGENSLTSGDVKLFSLRFSAGLLRFLSVLAAVILKLMVNLGSKHYGKNSGEAVLLLLLVKNIPLVRLNSC